MTNRNFKLVLEIPATLVDDTWTERDLIDNAVFYLGDMIAKAERDNHARFPGEIIYTLDAPDVALFTAEGYLLDIAELAALEQAEPEGDACPICNGKGYLLDQGYGHAEIPGNAIPVQRCDECEQYEGDDEAAEAALRDHGTTWGFSFRFHDPENDGTEVPDYSGSIGDYWITLPFDPSEAEGTATCLDCGDTITAEDPGDWIDSEGEAHCAAADRDDHERGFHHPDPATFVASVSV